MKILIVNAYTRNNGGDAAILSALISQLKVNWPNSEILISSMETPVKYPVFETCKNIGSIRFFAASEDSSKITRVSHKIIAYFVETVWLRMPKQLATKLVPIFPVMIRTELTALLTSDIIVSLGGGYLNGKDNLAGNLNVRFILLPLKIAEHYNKLVICAPQSYGPFGNAYQKYAVRTVLNKTKIIMVREDESLKYLGESGVDKNLIYRTVDLGFAFDTDRKSTRHNSGNIVGITARAWLDPDAQNKYENALVKFIEHICKGTDFRVILIPQVTSEIYSDDDRIVEKRIKEKLNSLGDQVEQVDKRLSHHELKKTYQQISYTVGTRFHSVIFSLTSYVPAIAIEYEHKTGGIMKDLGLDQWVIKIEDVTAEKLIALFDKLLRDQKKYITQLEHVLPEYINEAEKTGQLIKKLFEQGS